MATKLIDQTPQELPVSGQKLDSPKPMLFGAALAKARSLPRASLPFRAVNRRDAPDFNPGFQRHHLLPRQLLQQRCFGPLFDLIGRERLGFDDFRANGLLLPASDVAALRIGLPMHRGPHRDYNSLVMERVGQVEESWSERRRMAPEIAASEAVQRLHLLQKALRRRLLDPRRKRIVLNRHDPAGRELDFSELDAMVDTLWAETDLPMAEPAGFVSPFVLAPAPVATPELAVQRDAERQLIRLDDVASGLLPGKAAFSF